jgi:hypothetical protein
MKPGKKAAVIAFVLLLAAGGVRVLLKPGQQNSYKLPEGSTITLVGISHGTNALIQGSVLDRLLGDRIPVIPESN